MELADVTDSKSVDGDIVWVRVPPPAPKQRAYPQGAPFALMQMMVEKSQQVAEEQGREGTKEQLAAELSSAGFRVPPPAPKQRAYPQGAPFALTYSCKINPYRKFFRNRSVFFGRWIDLSLGDDGSCTRPLSSGGLLQACKRIYVDRPNYHSIFIGVKSK